MNTAKKDNSSDEALGNAEEIIRRFGGIRPMAHKMAVPVTTVQGWKKRNVIPGNRRDDVVEAAKNNDVDLSGVLEKRGVANENSFGNAVKTASLQQDKATQEQHERAVAGAEETIQTTGAIAGMSHEELMKEMKVAEQKAVKKSAWISGGLMVLAMAGGAFLLWPSQGQVAKNGQDIAVLQGTTQSLEKKQSLFGSLMPDDFEKKMAEAKQQVEAVKMTVTDIKTQVQGIATDASNGDLGALSGRVSVLEGKINELTGASPGLVALMARVEALQKTVGGQEQLAGSLSDLRGVVMGLQGLEGSPETETGALLETTLEQAQQEEDSLGQTLEGVPPTDLKAAAMLLTLSQLRESLNRSAPFEEDLVLMQQLLGGEEKHPELYEAMNRLAPRSSEGVLTPEGLSNEFRGLAGEIVVASLKGEDVSVQERAKARFNEVLQVEKEGELITGTDTQATVARAQKMLDEGNVEAAIAELKSLEDETAADAAKSFIEEAELTLLVEKFQSQLTGTVMNNAGVKGFKKYSAGGVNLKSMAGDVKDAVTGGKLVTDEASGFSILVPEKKLPGMP